MPNLRTIGVEIDWDTSILGFVTGSNTTLLTTSTNMMLSTAYSLTDNKLKFTYMSTSVTVSLEKGKDVLYSIYIPDITGLFGTGETETEAKENLNEAIEMALEHVEETGDWGDYSPLKENYVIEYIYDLSGFFKSYDFFDVTALANRIGINASLMRRYKTGMKKASVAQKAKISNGIYAIAKQLSAVKF
jgi:predicted RNase H-like HicB family nuclease